MAVATLTRFDDENVEPQTTYRTGPSEVPALVETTYEPEVSEVPPLIGTTSKTNGFLTLTAERTLENRIKALAVTEFDKPHSIIVAQALRRLDQENIGSILDTKIRAHLARTETVIPLSLEYSPALDTELPQITPHTVRLCFATEHALNELLGPNWEENFPLS
ncbi:hypothetical protein HOE67_00085 [Candidatus Peregrinibacteria bacterium]|jgi:hypothetical protein|nr:hypothetical protein [Candidatus Peregrinibacteria bacterium]MBT4055492.1 hypothetical protein [Candidatus Peregrinibacteria bacterium]